MPRRCRARRRGRVDAAALARDSIELLAPLATPTAADLLAGLDLFERHEALGAFDAIAAVAVRLDAWLVSADRAFATVDGLRHVDPSASGLFDIVGGRSA